MHVYIPELWGVGWEGSLLVAAVHVPHIHLAVIAA
jgi:hypothetical protein